nr:hypothetical protein [Kofleriaceae bacterium]
MALFRLVACVLLVACYKFHPTDACEIACTTSCPDGLTCGANGLCHDPGAADCSPGGGDGGAVDSSLGSGSNCYGAGMVRMCFVTAPTGTLTLSGRIATGGSDGDDCMSTQSQGSGRPELCVFAGSDVVVADSSFARFVGTRPVAIVATGSIEIGTATGSGAFVVAGSERSGQFADLGPGADDASCDAGTAPTGSGGGAGGSFDGRGGNGGGPNNGMTGGQSGAIGGHEVVRGGCPGQAATGDAASLGHGGGGVWMIAGVAIDVFGHLDASGEGGATSSVPADGAGGSDQPPGGGGGAGGLIGLDAPAIHVGAAGAVTVGGGGGAGTGTGASTTGKDGFNPAQCTTGGGEGGAAGSRGVTGGNSSCGATLTGVAGRNSDTFGTASGGGGGGAGYLLTTVPITNDGSGNVQPAP